jgi:hypothetical protein
MPKDVSRVNGAISRYVKYFYRTIYGLAKGRATARVFPLVRALGARDGAGAYLKASRYGGGAGTASILNSMPI